MTRREAAQKNVKKALAKLKENNHFSSEKQSARRKLQIANEEAVADDLRSKGFEVFSPTVVCDRIAIKDGKVFFVEFKRTGQDLRPGQKKIKDLMPDNYLIVFE